MTKQMAKIAKIISKPVPGNKRKWEWNYIDDDRDAREDWFVTEIEKEARKVMAAVRKVSDVADLIHVWEEEEIIDSYESENLEKKLNERRGLSREQLKK